MQNILKNKKVLIAIAAVIVIAVAAIILIPRLTNQPKKLVMGTSPDFPPYESMQGDKYVGIEIDIMNKVAEKLGYELEIKPVDFDSVLPGVQTGTYDIGVSGFTVTEERKQNVLFSDVYYVEGISIVVKEGSEISGVSDLEGVKVAVQSGTTAESLCTENNYDLSSFKNNVEAEQALATGSVEAWVIDKGVGLRMIAAYNEEHPDNKLVMLSEPISAEPYAFAFKLDNKELADKVNGVIRELISSGEMEKIFANNGVEGYVAPEN